MIRKPVVSGQFYPQQKEILKKTIDEFLKAIPPPNITKQIIGIIVPHAGYPYSGLTASYAYKAIANQKYDAVIMLGPSHQAYIKNFAVYGEGKWQTPLGDVNIAEDIAHAIIKEAPSKIINQLDAHQYEHSLEVQLPFLQTVLKDFKIVPIMMLNPSYEDCNILAQAIAKNTRGKNILILASSDLYHGYSYSDCQKTDSLTLNYITKFDIKGLYDALSKEKAQACGGYPIVVLMMVADLLGAKEVKLLHRTNSNDVIGEKGGYCVGYASLVFLKENPTEQEEKTKSFINLSAEEKKELLRIARTSIESFVKSKKTPVFSPISSKLKEKYGVFVTIKKNNELRGCIGYIEGLKPLYQAVSEMAIAAATEDPRFPPVSVLELPHITLEITILSPLKKITKISEIEIGRHGLVVKKGPRHGLLLPQVATEYNWNRETFLSHTCWKAGLPDNAWKDPDTEIYIFEGLIIKED
ncbi:MAG: AmmeMemoRadiSam system protein B [candidate division WOR-3 bacterium]|nr:AmmeMemoRadiSam system protein B [candidate division WOR-3 bacterium]MDW7988221.1 AmmeMemoRadiSam system protein B [candidate division WOR-3 bacterium]